MHNCCNNYTRSQVLRSAAAEAGKGLPAIEPGMPAPAGTGLSRRSFLSWSAGLALSVYGASKIPVAAFEEGIAQAAQSDKILVSVFFDGGIDALSVLAPVGDPRYAQLRPNLALSPESGTEFTEDNRLRWHPAADGLATLHGEGKVSVFPAIGYEHPDQSHFTSRHYYEIGELDVGYHTGWLGRYLDLVGADDNPLQGLSMDGRLSPMIATADKPVAAIDSVDGYDLWSPVSQPVSDEMFKSFARFGSLPVDSPGLGQVRRATTQTEKLRQDLGGVGDFTSPVTYPETGFAHMLAGLAAYIGFGLPLEVVTISAPGGYDTHADQATDLDRNLRETSEGLARVPARPRGPRPRRSRPGRDVERVRTPARGERLGGHRPRRRRLRLRHRVESEGRDGRRIPGPGDARPAGKPEVDERLPCDVLLAAGAVARPGRRADHSRRLRVRSAGAGEAVRRVAAAVCALALAALVVAPALGAAGREAASTSSGCDWKRHTRRVVRHVRRHGKVRRVVRFRHWWSCRRIPTPGQVAGGDPAAPGSGQQTTEEGPTAARLGVKASEYKFVLSRPSVSAGELVVELDNQGEDPHNLNLQLADGQGPELHVGRSRLAETGRPPGSPCRPAPTGSGAACPDTKNSG